MRYGWTAAGAACLVAFAVQAQDSALQDRYSHVQDLNNTSWQLVTAKPTDPQKLTQAVGLLQQSLAASQALQNDTATDADLGDDAGNRHNDALRLLAAAYVMQGDRGRALDTLELLLQQPTVSASTAALLEKNPALASLHDEPRYQAVIAAFHRLDARWKAPVIAAPSAEPDEAHRIAGLSLFWSEARYNFVHFDHVPDLDWNQAYLDFLPKVIAAKNLHDYYDVMMQFAPLLHDGHTNIYPPASIAKEFYARPPIRTSLVDGHVLITALESPSVASRVHVGDEIVAIDGQDVRAYAQQHVAPYASSSTPQDAEVRAYDYQLLRGDHRKPVILSLRNAAGATRSVQLSREQDAKAVDEASFEWRMLPGKVAYLALNEFESDATVKAFEHALPEILHAKGLILDVRRNGGGSDLMGAQILSYLTDQPIAGGQSKSPDYVPAYRAGDGPYVAWRELSSGTFQSEHDQRFTGPVVLLIGPRTYSAAEDFVVAFDAMKRGTLVGEATGGSTGEPLQLALPGGGTARICAKADSYPDGREFVGKGIAPAVVVAPTVEDIRRGRDPVVQRALDVLSGKLTPPSTPAP